MTFKKGQKAKTLGNGLSMSETDPPQPQTVGLRDLVKTGITPVSTKTAVKYSVREQKLRFGLGLLFFQI